jgi:hypothetical protein
VPGNGANERGHPEEISDALSIPHHDFLLLAFTNPFGWNYKPAEKHCWLIFCERKILFRLKKQAE